jgi:hypothetical protein
MSEIVLSRLKTRISAYCNEFSQNRWFFAILPNSGGFANFPHKCDGFLELTLAESIKQQLARLLSRFSRTCLAVVLDVHVSPGSFAVHRYLAIGAGPTGARTHY